jgi:hypothetical protein
MYFPPGRPCSVLPLDLTPDMSEPAERALMADLKVCRRHRDIDRTLESNMAAMARYFVRQSQTSQHIGTGMQFGVQMLSGETEVMDIMPLSEFEPTRGE